MTLKWMKLTLLLQYFFTELFYNILKVAVEIQSKRNCNQAYWFRYPLKY